MQPKNKAAQELGRLGGHARKAKVPFEVLSRIGKEAAAKSAQVRKAKAAQKKLNKPA